MAIKRKSIYEISIEKLAYGGKGIGKIEDMVVFVPYAVPQDILKVKITRKKSNYAEAVIDEIVKPSEFRIEPKCTFFKQCGGCKWLNIPYENQIEAKRQIVQESFDHISGLKINVLPTLKAPKELAYRNKMEFTFSDVRWLLPSQIINMDFSKKEALGLHAPGAFDRVLDINQCYLQNEEMNNILNDVRAYVKENNFTFYHIRDRKGVFRFLILRKAFFSNQIMVNIITTTDYSEKLQNLSTQLMNKYENITSVINGVAPGLSQVAFTESETTLAGESFITENLDNFKFIISANSFFQTNSQQALNLYNIVKSYADLKGDEIVWDLYGGTGTIGIFISKLAKKVISVELVDSAIKDGKKNAELNNINNIEFINGDMRLLIDKIQDEPDVVITDPPRDGMHHKVVEALLNKKPPKIVYVSCNPTTMARDIALLKEGYEVKKVQPVDMFPQTYHIESVALLERK